MSKPNIVLILTDQMRSTAMGCAGVEHVRTPNLDILATQGTRFTNAIANTPSCAPSRASLFTGLHTLQHRVVNNELRVRNDIPALAGCLTDNDYACGYIGKWHLDGGAREAFTPPGRRRLGFDDYWAVANCTHNYMDSFYYEDDNLEPQWIDGYEPVHQANLSISFIERKAQEDRPFFLVWSPGTPHDPYRLMPQTTLAAYAWQDVELMDTNSRYVPQEIIIAKKQALAGYYAHITALDEQVGRVLASLDEQGLSERTIVVFTSDHGDMLGNHDAWYKSQPWRESVGVPLIMRWPGHIPENRVTNGPISIVDYMPTLLSLADTPVPSTASGEDLSAFVLGDDSAAPESVFINFPPNVHIIPQPPFRGVVTRTHTYAETIGGPWLLYDDQADFSQVHNLISWANRDDPQVGALQKSMAALLQSWLVKTDDSFEDGDEINDRYQPGHSGGVLPHPRDAHFDGLWAERHSNLS